MRSARLDHDPQVATAPLRPWMAGLSTWALEAYARRFGCTVKTAERHWAAVMHDERVSLYVADRWSALVGMPFAYVYSGTEAA